MSLRNSYKNTLSVSFDRAGFQKGRIFEKLLDLINNQNIQQYDNIEIVFKDVWYDLAELIYLVQLIEKAKLLVPEIIIDASELSNNINRIKFLWNCGFLEKIKVNQESNNVIMNPDPWRYYPGNTIGMNENKKKDSNFTNVISIDIKNDGSNKIKDFVNTFIYDLDSTFVYDILNKVDNLIPKDMPFLVLWELIINSLTHSKGQSALLSGQIFISPQDANKYNDLHLSINQDKVKNEKLMLTISNLVKTTLFEKSKTLDTYKKRWLISHSNQSYIKICFIDDGIGIHSSMRQKNPFSNLNDSELIERAFDSNYFKKIIDPIELDVHGLYQILRLIEDHDGYISVTCGSEWLEYDVKKKKWEHKNKQSIYSAINGTLFQILLPIKKDLVNDLGGLVLEANNKITKNAIHKSNHIYLFDELNKYGDSAINDKAKWPQIANEIINSVGGVKGKHLILDLLGLPRDRQLVSYFVRAIKRFWGIKSLVIINASKEIMEIVSSLRILDQGLDHDINMLELEKELATIISRGEYNSGLPLIIPISNVPGPSQKVQIRWLGLSGVNNKYLEIILNYLFTIPTAVKYEEIVERLKISNEYQKITLVNLELLIRCNPGLITVSPNGYEMSLNSVDLYLLSYGSYYDSFEKEIINKSLHKKKEHNYIYEMGWHQEKNKYRNQYYQLWNILSNAEYLEICGRLLMWEICNGKSENIFASKIIISVTPTAGLMAKWIARNYNMTHYESQSIYHIEKDNWLPELNRDEIIIICDLIDTKTLLKKTIERIKKNNGVVKAIATILINQDENTRAKTRSDREIIFLKEISLGTPTEKEIQTAKRKKTYYQINPYSLEPVEANVFATTVSTSKTQSDKNRIIKEFVSNSLFQFGHYEHTNYHYEIFFNISKLVLGSSYLLTLVKWLSTEIDKYSEALNHESIEIIYPYNSMVELLIRQYQRSKDKEKTNQRFHIAKPQIVAGDRILYSVESLPEGANIVFVDDGISTGNTFASVMEKVINKRAKNILSLFFVERLNNSQKGIYAYTSEYTSQHKTISKITFKSYLSIHLESYHRTNCPYCNILSLINNDMRKKGMVYFYSDNIKKMLSPIPTRNLWRDSGGIYTAEETEMLLLFVDAMLSGALSENEIERSVKRINKSVKVVLHNINFIFCDPPLYGMLSEKREELLASVFDKLYVSAEVENEVALFILKSTNWFDKNAQRDLLFEKVPNFVASQIKDDPLDHYFNRNTLLYCAIAIATKKYIYNQENNEQGKNDIISIWWECAERNESIKSSYYIYDLENYLSANNNSSISIVKHLIRNFITNYKDHSSSLYSSVLLFTQLLAVKNKKEALQTLPEAQFKSIIELFRSIAYSFGVHRFIDQRVLDRGLSLYSEWDKNEDYTIYEWLMTNLLVTNIFKEPPLIAMLSEITPRISEIIDKVSVDIEKKYVGNKEIDIQYSIVPGQLSERILGEKRFIIDTLKNLIENPIKYFTTKPHGISAVLNIKIVCEIDRKKNVVELIVDDNCGLPDDEIEGLFLSNKGLTEQNEKMKEWGGELLLKKYGAITRAKLVGQHIETEEYNGENK